MSELPKIIQLKIRLLGISPMIWRRVAEPDRLLWGMTAI